MQMTISRQEVSLRRLLARCELMCNNGQGNDEKMPKYIDTLEDLYQEIKKTDPSNELLTVYQARLSKLKGKLGIVKDKYIEENEAERLREDLLGIRHRNSTKSPVIESQDLDQIINYHENIQEKITEDMLMLTKNLKEQSKLATKIIKKDTEVLTKSAQLTDQNYSKLTTESTKLAEHSKRACKCWMWIMLAVVIIVFINMVLFMKVMKKK